MKIAMYQDRPFLMINDQEGQLVKNYHDVLSVIKAGPDRLVLGAPQEIEHRQLMAPIPQPRQIFAVGMNYLGHTQEIHAVAPTVPNVFTKFASSLTGPTTTIQRHSEQTDWETELVIVIGQGGRDISETVATQSIAGYMVGEDLSDRSVQFANPQPQFSLGKSFENFAPTGPWLTTPDEITDLKQLLITTKVNEATMQHEALANLVFDGPKLISYLSSIVELYPGDLIFTGTPEGTGVGHEPQVFLQAQDVVTASIDQLGSLRIDVA
ncbi:fumarylacetoacetate hydrolase family protein [Lapidilactobacillus bayanensis]|uniref:fumarylacetoacetate hydrolase family protein n=1 Tax=Lapidilactobacillus bayanensis TaxID=2485998 RepID=UPI000F791C2A|nr:fumarylacetoacetate hydrolase family protein [Lapidilactobacillus bayanensis]